MLAKTPDPRRGGRNRLIPILLCCMAGSIDTATASDDTRRLSPHFSRLFDPLQATIVRSALNETKKSVPDSALTAARPSGLRLTIFRIGLNRYRRGLEPLYVIVTPEAALTLHGIKDVRSWRTGGLVHVGFKTQCTDVTVSQPTSGFKVDTLVSEGCLGN